MVKECILNTGKLPSIGLPRNSVVRITVRPDMNLAVYSEHKALNEVSMS